MTEVGLGLDYGTTNNAACLLVGNETKLVDVDGSKVFPSAVAIPIDEDDDEWVFGKDAYNQIRNPRYVVIMNNKRAIGKEFSPEEAQELEKLCNAPIRPGERGEIAFKVGGRKVTPIEIATRTIKYIVDRVIRICGKPISRVVYTHPVNFNNDRSAAIKTAVFRAVRDQGIRRIDIETCGEPEAATYCYMNRNITIKGYGLVFDMGGGTLDVSVFNVVDGECKVRGHYGNEQLGGSDVDRALGDKFYNNLADRTEDILNNINTVIGESTKLKRKAAIQENARKVKEALSYEQSNTVNIYEDMFWIEDEDEDYSFEYTRKDMNRDIKHIIKNCEDVVDEALKTNHLEAGDISHVILVGGSCYLHAIKDMLTRKFGKEKLRHNVDPSTCVAEGSVCYLRKKLQDPASIQPEKCSHSLGISVANERIYWLFPSNSDEAKLTMTFSTTEDNQETARFRFYEGRSDEAGVEEDIRDRKPIGKKVEFEGFKIAPKGETKFQMKFSYKGGLIHVVVHEVETNILLFDQLLDPYELYFRLLPNNNQLLMGEHSPTLPISIVNTKYTLSLLPRKLLIY